MPTVLIKVSEMGSHKCTCSLCLRTKMKTIVRLQLYAKASKPYQTLLQSKSLFWQHPAQLQFYPHLNTKTSQYSSSTLGNPNDSLIYPKTPK